MHAIQNTTENRINEMPHNRIGNNKKIPILCSLTELGYVFPLSKRKRRIEYSQEKEKETGYIFWNWGNVLCNLLLYSNYPNPVNTATEARNRHSNV